MRLTIRRTAPRLAGLALCLPLLMAACSKSNDTATTDAPSTTAAGAINAGPTIDIAEFKFGPENATVKTGQVVTWKNSGSAKHQVQEEAKADGKADFESTLMKTGDTYQFTPTTPGQYTYFCRIHPDQMRATLTVTP